MRYARVLLGLSLAMGCGGTQVQTHAEGERWTYVATDPQRTRAEHAAREGLALEVRVHVQSELERDSVRRVVTTDRTTTTSIDDVLERTSRQATDLVLEGVHVDTTCDNGECRAMAWLSAREHVMRIAARQTEREAALGEALARVRTATSASVDAAFGALPLLDEIRQAASDLRELWLWRLAFEPGAQYPSHDEAISAARTALFRRVAFAPQVSVPGTASWRDFVQTVIADLPDGCHGIVADAPEAAVRLTGDVSADDGTLSGGMYYVSATAHLRLDGGAGLPAISPPTIHLGLGTPEEASRRVASVLAQAVANALVGQYHCAD